MDEEEKIPLLNDNFNTWSLSDLPDEIIQKIIGYSLDSFNSTARVSPKFNEYTYALNFSSLLEQVDNFSFKHYWVTDVLHSLDRIIALEKIHKNRRTGQYINKINRVCKAADGVQWSPIFWWKRGKKKYKKLSQYHSIDHHNCCRILSLSIGRDFLLLFSMIIILLSWILLICYVHLPLAEAEHENIKIWTNATAVVHQLDAKKVGCYTHQFTKYYSPDFDRFLQLSTQIHPGEEIDKIFTQFSHSVNEYQSMIKNLTNLTKEKWKDKTYQHHPPPFTTNYTFTTCDLDITILTYRYRWWYSRDFTAHYDSVPCLVEKGRDIYEQLSSTIQMIVGLDLGLFLLVLTSIVLIKIYNITLEY